MNLVERLRTHLKDYGAAIEAADRIEALEAALRDVRAEINLHKSPQLAARIDALVARAALAPEDK